MTIIDGSFRWTLSNQFCLPKISSKEETTTIELHLAQAIGKKSTFGLPNADYVEMMDKLATLFQSSSNLHKKT